MFHLHIDLPSAPLLLDFQNDILYKFLNYVSYMLCQSLRLRFGHENYT